MSKTQPTVELSARFGLSKVMPQEQELDFIKSQGNLKEQQMVNMETGLEMISNE